MDVGRLITQAEAARRLAISPKQIQRLLEAGVLRTSSTACGLRLVTLASVRQYQQKRRPAGRPKGGA